MPMRRAVFIVNPAARTLPSRDVLVAAIEAARRDHSIAPEIRETDGPLHATQIAAEAENAGAELIVACGGDGTLNEVLNGVRRPDLPIGVIPGGTANVWAKEAGIPRRADRALRAQLSGTPVRVDLGRAAERRFLLMAGLGLDAATVAAVRPGLKRCTGPLAYAWTGLRVGGRYPGFQAAVRFDDDPAVDVEATMIVLGNTRNYGGVATITAEASAVDGQLDCVVFRGRGLPGTLRMLALVLLRRHLRSRHVLYRRARRIVIEGAAPPMQLDGDAVPQAATAFSVEPAAVTMLVPWADRPVFQPLP